MVKPMKAVAQPSHDGQRFANSYVSMETVQPATRISLRIKPENAAKLTRPLGLKLPLAPKTSITKNGQTALWLGPDEWMIIDNDPNAAAGIIKKLEKHDCSVVDISHRNMAAVVSGSGVEDLLSAGCPQDLSLDIFPVGACSRTIFGKAEIVLWRCEANTFRIEVWRSFADYLWAYLLDAAKDAGN